MAESKTSAAVPVRAVMNLTGYRKNTAELPVASGGASPPILFISAPPSLDGDILPDRVLTFPRTASGLMSYAANVLDAYHQAGIYTDKIF